MNRRAFLQGLVATPVAAAAAPLLPKLAVTAPPAVLAATVPGSFATVEPCIRSMSTTFAIGFRVTQELIDDEQWDLIRLMADDAGQAVRELADRVIADAKHR